MRWQTKHANFKIRMKYHFKTYFVYSRCITALLIDSFTALGTKWVKTFVTTCNTKKQTNSIVFPILLLKIWLYIATILPLSALLTLAAYDKQSLELAILAFCHYFEGTLQLSSSTHVASVLCTHQPPCTLWASDEKC